MLAAQRLAPVGAGTSPGNMWSLSWGLEERGSHHGWSWDIFWEWEMTPRWEGSGSLDSKRKKEYMFPRYLSVPHPLLIPSAVNFERWGKSEGS